MGYQPIENYGIVGDLRTTALISVEGSIDFMCFPDFDSPTIFAALLDHDKGGHFQIAPASGEFKHHQWYSPDTNILLSGFLGEHGIALVSDFMTLEHLGRPRALVRRVKAVRGEIPIRVVCSPKFDYGRAGHRVEKKAQEIQFLPEGKNLPALVLRASVPMKVVNGEAHAQFKLSTNESAFFILQEAGALPLPAVRENVTEVFKETMNYWLEWISRSRYRGRWRETINRSTLVLKLLTSQRHKSMVAAPTFGLPERLGGERNWDYRYTWIRDACFALHAFLRLGYNGEAQALMEWMQQRCGELKPGKPLQVMYRLDGSRDLKEITLKHLEGYNGSRPVRIGNAASAQLQLDIYGELLGCILNYDLNDDPISHQFWTNITAMVDWVCQNWRRPDEGIWEVRGGARPFLFSRAMCWVAIDRAMKIAIRRSLPAPIVRWHRVRDEIYHYIHAKYWNRKLNSFVQYRGASNVDASLLLLPIARFISPGDPRWQSTLKVIEEHLVEDSLVYRYRPSQAAPDGVGGPEGTFSMCSFWYVECVALANDLKRARFIFEKALGFANHLGLYAEQLGPCGEHLGNFPQAFSHIGLISAAWALDERFSKLDPRPI